MDGNMGSQGENWQRPALNGRRIDSAIQEYEAGYGPGGFSVRQSLANVWRFRYFVLAAVLVSLGIGYYKSVVAEERYRAGSVIHISPDQGNALAGIGGGVARMLGGAAGGGLRSHVELIRSMAVLTEVVDRTGLQLVEIKKRLPFDEVHPTVLVQDPKVLREPDVDRLELRFGEDDVLIRAGREERRVRYGVPVEIAGLLFTVGSRPDVDEGEILVMPRFAAAELLARSLDVRVRTDTNVLDIMYAAYDPIVAQRVVNATVESFREFDNRRKREEARARGAFLSQQIEYTDSLLSEVQHGLIDFQQRVQGRSSRERFTAQQSGLIDLERRRVELESDRAMYRNLLAELGQPREPGNDRRIRAIASAPLMIENPVFESLVERLMDYEGTRDRLTAGSWGSAQSNPEVARLDTLIIATEARLADAVASLVDGLDARVAALDELHARSVSGMRSLPAADAEELRLEYQIEAVADVLKFLQEEYHMARVEEAVGSGRVEIIDLARPGDPFGADPLRTIGFALIFGLMLGSGGALLLGNFSSSIRQRDEVEQVLHVSRLGVIPSLDSPPMRQRIMSRIQNGNGVSALPKPAHRHLLVAAGYSHGAEAFRALRTNLIFGRGLGEIHTIAVTSGAPSEGRTTTVANLAIAFAQHGMRVLVVDCDLRRPQLHKIFDVRREPGLGELLVGDLPAEQVVLPADVPGLSVIPAGAFFPQALHLVGTPRIGKVLENLTAGFDVVLLDTPPLQVTVDGAAIAAYADATIFLVRAGKTDRRAAQAALQQLNGVGANVVGAVLNDADEKAAFPKAYGEVPG